ncbi:MAG: S8 family serine peptidase [Chloroflexota bacterium]
MVGVGYGMQDELPAFSWPIREEDQPRVLAVPWQEITPEWAWGGATGEGVKVCLVDSGVDAEHPMLGGMLKGGAVVERGDDGVIIREEAHDDLFGHGTACGGIIHGLAPEAEIYSVRVLGPNLKGSGEALVEGVRWAVEHGMDVINLSLSTRKLEHIESLHRLADQAYFQRSVVVASANNTPVLSYPWLFSSVISVASHADQEPHTFYYNPEPPVEFTAPGVDLELAWADGALITGTGNSYATPHISGIVAQILSKHRQLTPFQIKTVLYYTAKNVREALGKNQ